MITSFGAVFSLFLSPCGADTQQVLYSQLTNSIAKMRSKCAIIEEGLRFGHTATERRALWRVVLVAEFLSEKRLHWFVMRQKPDEHRTNS